MRIFVIILFFALRLSVDAATYYMHASGSDSNDGSAATVGSGWRNISKATSTAVAGDTIIFPTNDTTTWAADTLTETTSGSGANYISYVGNGTRIFRAVLSGSRIRLVDFEITHSSGTSTGMTLGGDFIEVIDNYIHNTGDVSIDPNGSDDLIIRGNRMLYSGSPGNNSGAGTKTIQDNGDCNRVLIEYNHISNTTDFTCPRGTEWSVRNNVLGPSLTTDFGGTPHVDGWQSNAQHRNGWMYRNWHVDNSVSDSHMILIENPVNGRNGAIAVFQNVSLRSGDTLWYQMRDGTNLYCMHNTVGQIGFGPRGGPGSSGFIRAFSEEDASTKNYSRNNIFTNVTTGTVYDIAASNEIIHSHDLVFPASSDLVNGVNGNIELDPKFVDYAATNLLLQATSPVIDVGTNITKVTSASGTGTSFVVEDSTMFPDGSGLCEGITLIVGTDVVKVTGIDYTTHTITCASFTWAQNDLVWFYFRGSGPDFGAYEYGDTLLSAATYEVSGGTLTGTATGDAEMMIVYNASGVPVAIDTDSPWSVSDPGVGRTVRFYALHAQYNPVVDATESEASGSPTALGHVVRAGSVRAP